MILFLLRNLVLIMKGSEELQFEYYVLRYDWNNKKVITWNIFNNINVQEWTEKAVKKYLRNPKQYCYETYVGNGVYSGVQGFEALCKEIDSVLRHDLWSRREYEISVSDAFEDNIDNFEKWDCYMQCKPNIPIITREVIRQYKEQRK